MGKYGKPLLIGLAVLVAVSFVVGFLGGMVGADLGALPMIMGFIAGAVTTYLLSNLAGTEREVAASSDDKTAALNLRPAPGQALVIVFREGFVGSAAGLNISIDGRRAVQLKSPRFAALSVTPGEHLLEVRFGGLAEKQNTAVEKRFSVAAGEVAAYRIGVSMGAMKNTVSVEPAPADAALSAKLRTVKMTAPDQDWA